MVARADLSVLDPMLPRVARLVVHRQESPDVATLSLDLPGWEGAAPGQFNMLGLPGLGEAPISLSGGTAAGARPEHTVRGVGPLTRALAWLSPGADLTLRGPYGAAWPLDTAPQDILIVAGGLGLAPLRPVIRHFADHPKPTRNVQLVIGARSPADIAFVDDITQWRHAGLSVQVTVDHAPPGWPGRVGVVTPLIRVKSGMRAYLCGPEIMMRVVAEHLTGAGLPETDIHLSLERHMQCGVGLCGHCQLGGVLLCRDGPVLDWARARPLMQIEEL